MKAYTDYPIADASGVVEVKVLAYDRNKYATVRLGEHVTDVKSGYLFRDRDLSKPLKTLALHQLPVSCDHSLDTFDPRLQPRTKFQARAEWKAAHKSSTQYFVDVHLPTGRKEYRFDSLLKSLVFMAKQDRAGFDISLYQSKQDKGGSVGRTIFDTEDRQITFYGRRSERLLVKRRHLKAHFDLSRKAK